MYEVKGNIDSGEGKGGREVITEWEEEEQERSVEGQQEKGCVV